MILDMALVLSSSSRESGSLRLKGLWENREVTVSWKTYRAFAREDRVIGKEGEEVIFHDDARFGGKISERVGSKKRKVKEEREKLN